MIIIQKYSHQPVSITNSTDAGRFPITETKLYVPVVTLSTQDNTKLLQQTKILTKRQNQYLYYLIDPIFQGVN